MSNRFTHIDTQGKAQMVDVGKKDISRRQATAQVTVLMSEKTYGLLKENKLSKGDALAVSRIAGVMAAKKTSDLIPLCHQIAIDKASINFDLDDAEHLVRITSTSSATSRTGVEMEALTSCAVAALTLYDMLKSAQKDIVITNLNLLEKSGGKSGDFKNQGK